MRSADYHQRMAHIAECAAQALEKNPDFIAWCDEVWRALEARRGEFGLWEVPCRTR